MKRKISNFTIGADVEMFLQNLETHDFVSAEGYIPGTKHEPFQFDVTDKHFAVSLDNVAAEFCIPPVKTPEDWEAFLMKGVAYINTLAPQQVKCVAAPAAYFAERYLQTENAMLFGCEPDYNVWLRDVNQRPNAAENNLRSAGGHIHIGHDIDSDADCRMMIDEALVKAMDIFIGLPSVLIEPANRRKELYGKAGAFRLKPYGIEYRTVSNFYMASPELRKYVFENTVRAINFVNDTECESLVPDEEGMQIVRAINRADAVAAKDLCEKYNVPLI